ncbi:hypothetical protein K458DRAFT_313567, partial [Lentithecium fluviatile CBS 122367]
IDYYRLNNITIKNRYLLPNASKLEYLNIFIIVYLNNILIYLEKKEDYINYVITIL